MAAHTNPNLSTLVNAAAPVEELPAVEVFTTRDGVVVKWGESGAKQTTVLNPDTTLYSAPPYSFSAVDSNGEETFIKTFGNLLSCNGGTLTIGDGRYRIQVKRQQEEHPALSLAAVKRQAEEAVQRALAKRRRDEPPERILSFISKSHAFSDAKTAGRITFGHNFFFELLDPVTSTAFSHAAPANKADENKLHHPYFLREVAKLVNSALAVGKPINQQLLWTKAGHYWLSLDDRNVAGVEPDFVTTRVDVCRKNGDGSQFYVGKPENGTEQPSKYDVTLAFTQKKAFVDSDQIEAVDYAERILRIQRGRKVVYTALFHCCENEKIIRWMRVSPGDGHYVTEISRPESLAPSGLGQRQLLTMLSKTSEELGRAFPDLGLSDFGDTIKISCLLGHGATADVYLGTVGEREGVLKVLKDDFTHLADHEASILANLIQASTPFLSICRKLKEGILFFDEILRPVRVLTPRHVACLLECLRHTHNKARVVHRDFRPDNIMETGDGNIRVIDWGFAHILGSAAPPFEGTFRFASEDALDAAIIGVPRTPKPEDDLESFVRVVFAMADGLLWHALARINDGDFAAAKHLWRNFKQENPRQADMFNAAANLDYEALKNILPGLQADSPDLDIGSHDGIG